MNSITLPPPHVHRLDGEDFPAIAYAFHAPLHVDLDGDTGIGNDGKREVLPARERDGIREREEDLLPVRLRRRGTRRDLDARGERADPEEGEPVDRPRTVGLPLHARLPDTCILPAKIHAIPFPESVAAG